MKLLIVSFLFLVSSCSHLYNQRDVASTLDSKSCRDFTESAAPFLTYTKTMNPKNVLYFSVRYDASCKSVGEILPYWIMGESDSHCEALASNERKYFGPSAIQVQDRQTSFTMGVLGLVNSKQKLVKLSDRIVVTLTPNSDGTCSAKAVSSVTESGKTENIVFENFHAKVRMLSIESITVKGKKSDNTPYLKTLPTK